MSGWLSLKITDKAEKGSETAASEFRISVPKKVIPLATQRNRIKRLIREVVRKRPVLQYPGKIYLFKVVKKRENLDLHSTLEAIDSLIE